jgi:hypothetical protein
MLVQDLTTVAGVDEQGTSTGRWPGRRAQHVLEASPHGGTVAVDRMFFALFPRIRKSSRPISENN